MTRNREGQAVLTLHPFLIRALNSSVVQIAIFSIVALVTVTILAYIDRKERANPTAIDWGR